MKSPSDVIAAFFLDGAKIVFGSLVVGVFVPGVATGVPWVTVASALAVTVLFLGIAVILSQGTKETSQ